MGAYLDTPIKEKNPEHGSFSDLSWGACSMQGWRVSMEDAHIATEVQLSNGDKAHFFGVFDGHGGKEVAIFAKAHIKRILENELKGRDIKKALENTFMKLDDEVSNEDYAHDTGSTSCCVLITPTEIYCCNAGDSRAVLCHDNKAYPLSEDHKPDSPGEYDRILKTNSHTVEDSRVDGNLALSRAFGDFQYKDEKRLKPDEQAVTASPDITVRKRIDKKDDFIMLACDGIWDCLTNEQCIDKVKDDYINKMKKERKELSYPVELLFTDILAPHTEDGIGTDNMTAVLIMFNNGKSATE